MGLETVTHISDLVVTNPTSADPKSQGDDQFRIIKTAVKNDFPGFAGSILVGGTDTGAANAYVLSTALPAYAANTMVVWKPTNANTGASTININGLGARAIKRVDGSPLSAGELPANRYVAMVYDGTDFQLFGISKAYIDALSFNSALPGQAGNDDKLVTTSGGVASWTGDLKTGTIRLVDSADVTKKLALDISGFAAGTTRTLTVPDRAGAIAIQGKGGDIVSAATVNLDAATGDFIHITGTTPITAITLASGAKRDVVFDGVLTLTHNSTSLILPGGANIATAAGDRATFRGEGGGNVRCIHYTRASGQAIVAPPPSPVTVYFQSADQTITSAGKLTIAHGLGAVPKLVRGYLKNQTADLSYVPGDITEVYPAPGDYGMAITCDATNIYVTYGSHVSIFFVLNKNTGVMSNIVQANWKFFVRAYA